MKPLRIVCGGLIPAGSFYVAFFFVIGIYVWFWEDGSFFGALLCFALAFGVVYLVLTGTLWIEISDRLTYRNILHGIHTHEWADVQDVEIIEDYEEPDELIITLVNGKKLRVEEQYRDQIRAALSEVLKDKDQDERVRQQVEKVRRKFQSPVDKHDTAEEEKETITLDL